MGLEAGTQSSSPYVVTGVTTVRKEGLYNPFTLSGTIMVNGLAASSHSDWFLDQTFDFLGLTHQLPDAYQIVLSPARALYYLLGKEVYISVYSQLDALIDMATFGTKYGGLFVSTLVAGASTTAGVTVLISKRKH
ncbi:hypothetical protein R1flu_011638 [Riccia fluitans]|uniref:Hedgehog protein Hint domain-containing protein n=1 Tax=Riccia fluitans TaxID=41844 RepID=A0ABD1Z8D2_9MARC